MVTVTFYSQKHFWVTVTFFHLFLLFSHKLFRLPSTIRPPLPETPNLSGSLSQPNRCVAGTWGRNFPAGEHFRGSSKNRPAGKSKCYGVNPDHLWSGGYFFEFPRREPARKFLPHAPVICRIMCDRLPDKLGFTGVRIVILRLLRYISIRRRPCWKIKLKEPWKMCVRPFRPTEEM